MDLEDMVLDVKRPIKSLFLVAELLQDIFIDYSCLIAQDESGREFIDKMWGAFTLLEATIEHLEKIKEEYNLEVEKLYSKEL